MKYGIDSKAYLCAILDLGHKSIISFVFENLNNDELVFKKKLDDAGVTQNMSIYLRKVFILQYFYIINNLKGIVLYY